MVAFDGVSHSSFMDSRMLPKAVVKNDLKPEVEEKDAHEMAAKSIVAFIANLLEENTAAKGYLDERMKDT